MVLAGCWIRVRQGWGGGKSTDAFHLAWRLSAHRYLLGPNNMSWILLSAGIQSWKDVVPFIHRIYRRSTNRINVVDIRCRASEGLVWENKKFLELKLTA